LTNLFDVYSKVRQTSEDRVDNDFYPTPPIATLSLLKTVSVPKTVWEPAAGKGHIALELARNGHSVMASDLYGYDDRMYTVAEGVDFLETTTRLGEAIVTNPPYKSNMAEKFVRHSLETLGYDFVAMFVRLTFLESARRHVFFKEHPPSQVLVFSERIQCDDGYFNRKHGIGGMIAYCWMVWDRRGLRPSEYKKQVTTLSWIRPSDFIGDLADGIH
jgi:hypothetical protein